MGKRFRTAVIILGSLIVSAAAHAAGSPGANDAPLKIEPISFTILNPDNHEVVGHAEYKIENLDGRILVLGENHYENGEHDVEQDELTLNDGNTLPVMVKFEHAFFKADGAQHLIARADPRSGYASCVSYEAGRKHELSEKLRFPSDTYAGAAAVVAMENAFRTGHQQMIFHTFDCAPGPTLAPVMAQRGEQDEHWGPYPKPLIQVKLTAKLGWVGDFLGSLLPHRSAWFDPANGWRYVGGKIQRYLANGPQVILVREEHAQRDVASDAP